MSETVSDSGDQSSNQNNVSNNENIEKETEIALINKKNDLFNEQMNNLLVLNTFYYIFVFAIIGLPIWFFTTTTYRASLPFDQIDQVSLQKEFNIKIKLSLIHYDVKVSDSKLNNLKDGLLTVLNTEQSKGLYFDFDLSARKSSKSEVESAAHSTKIEDLDNLLFNVNLNELNVYIFDESLANKFDVSNQKEFLFLNNLYLNEKHLTDFNSLAKFLKHQYLHKSQLVESFNTKLNFLRKIPTKDELKVVNFDSNYEITFSLINSKPEIYSNWNIEFCVEKYFQKIIDQLSVYTNFSLKAQVLLFSEFDSYPMSTAKLSIENSSIEKTFYYLKPNDLSIMTNHIENRLGSRISDSSALEFVTYVPSRQPLYISSDLKNPSGSRTSSFLVPRWGAIYIYNHLTENDKTIKVNEAMKVFLTQFIDLIGIRLNPNPSSVIRSQIYQSEIFGYLISNTLNNLFNSINTLNSLSLLLTKISSMVIEDKIAEQVELSISSIKKCIEYLQQGKIDEAFSSSKIAFSSSEKAFFDESLLEKLYFPEDQRFAIYIPLFIPVGIPIVLSIKSIISYIKKRKIDQKSKTE